MALTKAARSKILFFVQESKKLLIKEVEEQLQQYYGIRPDGTVLLIEQLATAESDIIYTARLLRQRLRYLKANLADEKDQEVESVRQLVREQAFTIINRFASLRMAEERGIIKETIRKEYNSEGFQVFDSITGQGQTSSQYIRYKWYLYAIFDELALDLPSMFDRYSPYALIFPSEPAMNKLLDNINKEELTLHREEGLQPINLWKEDETIGWVYQYYNSRDEITAMRDASNAPRNSQELAIRNQFFTPRYVVQFLTDNSLGRIWYEMTQGNTKLKTVCSYLIIRPGEVFLKKGETRPEKVDEETNYVDYRPIKDPREILMLDPACGSMHFGLYVFDILEHIYLEAWDNHPGLLTDLRSSMTRQAFVQQIPVYIIRYNIHGVDIDPRALQIAGLSLWLRAQKSFDKQNLPANLRPQIKRSNLVLAEPIPGSIETLNQLVLSLEAPMRKLVLSIWDQMKLAGELGVLLRIEEQIDKKIKEIYRDSFLDAAEAEVLKILQQLSETATNGDAYQKLLFADDSARGFAFIELCRNKYDLVLMNPPFGLGVKENFEWLKSEYPDSYVDLLATFVQRGFELSNSHVGAITSRSILITPKLERIRQNMLIGNLTAIIDLGNNIMDNALVQSAAYILHKQNNQDDFIVLDRKKHAEKIQQLASSLKFEINDESRFVIQRETFFHTPKNKILYNLSSKVLDLFKANKKLIDVKVNAKQGMKTFDDFRFVRIRQEIDPSKIGKDNKWRSYSKGGRYGLFYKDLEVLIRYDKDGIEVQEVNRQKNNMTAQARQASSYYYLEGGNFSRRSKDFGVKILPKDFVIGEKGPLVISTNKTISNLLLVGLLNSTFYNYLINIQANANQYDTGIIENLPFFELNAKDKKVIEQHVIHSINALKLFDSFREETALFQYLPTGGSLKEMNDQIVTLSKDVENSIELALSSIDQIIDGLLGINSLELLTMISDFNEEGAAGPITYKEKALTVISVPDELEFAQRLISYAFGILCGRWHHPSAMAKVVFDDTNIFENYNGKVIGLSDAQSKDIIFTQSDAQIDGDLEKDMLGVIRSIWNSESLVYELMDLISHNSFTAYFLSTAGFFDFHFNLYTSSRRTAPVYWPVSTTSGSFTIWLYYPKLNDQTLYKIISDFIIPKKTAIAEDAKKLKSNQALDNTGKKQLRELQDLLYELQVMEKELLEVATLPYKPNQDDGVLITAAPLHKFFRHNKWRNETEACWNELEKGEYDWAHLAYSIWPERVTKKCKSDMSMAIAHGLEDLCEAKPKEKKEQKASKPKKNANQRKLID